MAKVAEVVADVKVVGGEKAAADMNKFSGSTTRAQQQVDKASEKSRKQSEKTSADVEKHNRRSTAAYTGMAGAAGGALGALTAGPIANFVQKSMTGFSSTAAETSKLQRVMGGSAEDVSRLGFAAKQSGVDSDVLAKSMTLLSKGLTNTSKAGSPAQQAMAKLGISYKDAQGKILPMTALMPQLAAKFKAMPAGAEKTALAMNIFGKSGASLLPLLNKGSDGMAELAKKSDELGLTMTGENLKAFGEQKKAQREMQASLAGLSMSVGKELVPVLVDLCKVVTTNVVPVLKTVITFVKENKSWLIPLAVAVVGVATAMKLWGIATKAWLVIQGIWKAATVAFTVVQWALNVALSANPIGLIIIAVVALVAAIIYAYKHSETFRKFVQALGKVLLAVFKAVWGVIKKVWDVLVDAFKWVGKNWSKIGTILGGPIVWAAKWLIGHWNEVWAFFKSIPGKLASLGKTIVNVLTWPFRTAFNAISKLWNATIGKFSITIPDWVPMVGGKTFSMPQMPELQALATGGTVTSAGAFLVGERGPEVVNLPRGAAVTPNGGGGATYIINVEGTGLTQAQVRAQFDAAMDARGRANVLRTWQLGGLPA